MKSIVLLLVGSFYFMTLFAQVEPEQDIEQGKPNNQQNKTNRLYGKLIDKHTGKVVEAASVQLYPAGRKKTSVLIDGMVEIIMIDRFTNSCSSINSHFPGATSLHM